MQEDVLSTLRPFCANVLVPAKVKTAVLHALEGCFDLSGEDTFLLVFYQTEAIVTANWKKEVKLKLPVSAWRCPYRKHSYFVHVMRVFQLLPENIDSDEKRHDLFVELLKKSTSLEELSSVGTLLHIWPVLAATELRYIHV